MGETYIGMCDTLPNRCIEIPHPSLETIVLTHFSTTVQATSWYHSSKCQLYKWCRAVNGPIIVAPWQLPDQPLSPLYTLSSAGIISYWHTITTWSASAMAWRPLSLPDQPFSPPDHPVSPPFQPLLPDQLHHPLISCCLTLINCSHSWSAFVTTWSAFVTTWSTLAHPDLAITTSLANVTSRNPLLLAGQTLSLLDQPL